MVILSEFQLIYSNKKFAKIKIRNFRKNRNCDFAIFATFAICEIAIFAISQITQFDSERGIAISQITQLDFGPILQPWFEYHLYLSRYQCLGRKYILMEFFYHKYILVTAPDSFSQIILVIKKGLQLKESIISTWIVDTTNLQ